MLSKSSKWELGFADYIEVRYNLYSYKYILSAKNILPYIYMQEKKFIIGIATIYLSVCTILNTYVHSVHTPINCERNNTVINYFHVIYFFRLTKDDYITYATIFISSILHDNIL